MYTGKIISKFFSGKLAVWKQLPVSGFKRFLAETKVAVAERNIDFVYRRFGMKTVPVVSKS